MTVVVVVIVVAGVVAVVKGSVLHLEEIVMVFFHLNASLQPVMGEMVSQDERSTTH